MNNLIIILALISTAEIQIRTPRNAAFVQVYTFIYCLNSILADTVIINIEIPLQSFCYISVLLWYVWLNQMTTLILCLLVSSADNLCKQFGSRSGPTKRRSWSGSKQFDTVGNFEKSLIIGKNTTTKISIRQKACNRQRVNGFDSVGPVYIEIFYGPWFSHS